MSQTGETSTSQMSQRALALRFLTRTTVEVAQMRACLPVEPLTMESVAIAHIERLAGKISGAAEAFGFAEMAVIAGAIELLAGVNVGATMRERLQFAARLNEQVSALEVYVEYELAQNESTSVPEELPLAAYLPRFSARRK